MPPVGFGGLPRLERQCGTAIVSFLTVLGQVAVQTARVNDVRLSFDQHPSHRSSPARLRCLTRLLRLAKRPSLPFAGAATNRIEGKRFGRPLANKIEVSGGGKL